MKTQDAPGITRLAQAARAALLGLLLLGAVLLFRLTPTPPEERELASFATPLEGRTEEQRHNACLSLRALDGVQVAPGAVFSFNRLVRSWSLDQGYVKAPVSYDGELIRAYGGGVCQTSTTLYNAVLLAGLPVLERHPHVFAPRYVPPGRDAAVAQPEIDLRFRNPLKTPLRIQAEVRDERLEVRLYCREPPLPPVPSISVETRVLGHTEPQQLTRVIYAPEGSGERAFVRNPGATGWRVLTYRVVRTEGREVGRERLSDDTYQAMNRIVQLTRETDAPQEDDANGG